jgi:hypothetical protein
MIEGSFASAICMHLTDVEKRSFKWGLLEEGISHGFSRRTVDHVKPHVPYRTHS